MFAGVASAATAPSRAPTAVRCACGRRAALTLNALSREPHRAISRHDWIALAILCALGTFFFADVLIGTQNVFMRDLTRYYYPTKQVLREVVQHGEFPYWNRYFSAGQPIAANPEHEFFYPLTWLILLPSYDLGYRLHILIHVYIGLLAMYAASDAWFACT